MSDCGLGSSCALARHHTYFGIQLDNYRYYIFFSGFNPINVGQEFVILPVHIKYETPSYSRSKETTCHRITSRHIF